MPSLIFPKMYVNSCKSSTKRVGNRGLRPFLTVEGSIKTAFSDAGLIIRYHVTYVL